MAELIVSVLVSLDGIHGDPSPCPGDEAATLLCHRPSRKAGQ
ncbi:hypothetical protein [Nocardia sp. alder85J]|nr:hypothetical protein [Nocardia sp. alder85J]MCX4098446.1 hypothetical protein [Nocardia sp. alder85J]